MSTELDVTADAPAPAPDDAAADAPAAVEVAATQPVAAPPPPAPDPTPEVEARLAALAPAASARQALDVVLRAWQVPPLAAEEQATTADFTRIAERRGLEHLALTGNTAMLRLLDVPVVLELQLPGATGPRYAALISMRDGVPVLAVGDGAPATVKPALLERAWYGQAYVLSRDFEGLGPGTLDGHSRGAPGQPPPGAAQADRRLWRDRRAACSIAATAAAVLDFQRSRYVSADGIVGRLTRVALYAAAGGYPRPTLTASPSARPCRGFHWRLVVSSILDALEKLERSRSTHAGCDPPGAAPAAAQTDRDRSSARACALGAAAAMMLFLRPAAHAPVVEPPPVAPAATPPVAAAVVTPPAAREPVATAQRRPPRARRRPARAHRRRPLRRFRLRHPSRPPAPASEPGRPEQAAAAPPAAPADGAGDRPALAAAAPVPPPCRLGSETLEPGRHAATAAASLPTARVAGTPPSHPTAARTAALEPEPPPIRRAPAGAPARPAQLPAVLAIGGASQRRAGARRRQLETLHEGESTGGLEVVRILPDRVDAALAGRSLHGPGARLSRTTAGEAPEISFAR